MKVISPFARKCVFLPLFLFGFLISFHSYGQQQDPIKLMAYNLLNYPAGNMVDDTTERNPYYRTTIASVNPDILVVEEILSQAGVTGFLNNVLNSSSSTYSAGVFINGTSDTENGIFYKTSKFNFVSNTRIPTALRDINEFKLVHILSGDTVRIYAVHLKSSATPADEAQRAAEVDSLRKVTNKLASGSDFIVCGDFNIYNSTESCYVKLLALPDNGQFIDPISMPGNWNSGSYAIRHTQSTRVTTWLNDGGSTGGMDDRFDLILYSKGISLPGGMTYVANSEIAYGNDGNHYNDSINKMPNTAVTVPVANALYHSSDHIPVIATFNFEYGGVSSPPDLGVLSLVAPVTPMCATATQSLQVQVKNFSSSDVNFAVNNLQVSVSATNPSSVNQVQTKTITSGTLTAGAVMNVTMDNPYNMAGAGTYTFNANTIVTGDANNSNNAMPVKSIVVNANPAATVSPAGPISLCNGGSVTLTASSGSTYLWSTTATTQNITVSASGNYSVTVSANGCSSTSAPVVVAVMSNQATTALFTETMDTVPGTSAVLIPAYESSNGFDNDNYFMYGTADVRNTTASSGYATASGAGNVFLTNTSSGRYFAISGINTTNLTNLELSFGIFKSSTASSASDFTVGVSTDSITYTNLTFAALPSGSGTATWYYRTAAGTIPATSNLRIRFRNDSTLTQYRVDDIVLKYTTVPSITASGPLTFCAGDSVTLTASSGSAYLWSTGATTQSIKVYTSGSYYVTVNCVQSSPVTVSVNSCSVTLNLRIFFEGFYSNGSMQPVLYNNGLSNDPTACDTVIVELHDPVDPNLLIATANVLLHSDGNMQVPFPPSVFSHSYYIVVRHRNSIETWSKFPVDFNSTVINFDFTSQ